jgi:hypothetical protein
VVRRLVVAGESAGREYVWVFETGRFTTARTDGIRSRDDFAAFTEQLLADYRDAGCREWENATLERFLDALAAFAGARLVDEKDQESASWRVFGEMLVGATGYE